MNEETLFIEALEIRDPAERAAYLDRACAGDPALRGRLERLLDQHQRAGSFLGRPAGADGERTQTIPPAGPVDDSGTTIAGRYKLLEQIGEGGMGTVWMAQQTEPVKRLVAVKLIKPGMDSKQVLARFEAERQALALMDHPNIAKVFDGGMTGEPDAQARDSLGRSSGSGRPYFVMELVKGVPITKYCDEHHLTPRQRLELFVPVCHAIQHAHQKGVIHRDLKPSNVLVALYDGKPVPKVIDFGVAKAAGPSLTEKTLVTGFGAIVGTLEYMSPEQAETNQLDIDTRSDIYSLGVLLYELLTGTTPFTKKDLEIAGMLEMLRVIREQEPSKPSTKLSTADGLPTLAANRGTEPAKLTKLMRGELDWIVMKALEKDRSRRYETANGFAMDVQRYLADEHVLACPPSAGYRLRKFVRRNKGSLAVAAVLLAAAMAVAGTLGWGLWDAAARRVRAEQAVAAALEEVEQWQAAGRWPEALIAARRAGMLSAASDVGPDIRRRVGEARAGLELVAQLEEVRLSRSIHLSEKTWVPSDARRADGEYARVFGEFGIDRDAHRPEEAAARIPPAVRIPVAAALDHWASVHDREPGRSWLRATAKAVDPDEWRNRLRDAAAGGNARILVAIAGRPEVDGQPPATLALLGAELLKAGHTAEALAVLARAQARHPGDFWLNMELARHSRWTNPWDAVRYATACVALRPESPGAHHLLGWALFHASKLESSVAAFQRAVDLKPDYASAYRGMGSALEGLGRGSEAVAAFREADRLDPGSGSQLQNKSWALLAAGDAAGAITALRAWLRGHPADAVVQSQLGYTLLRAGDVDGAEAAFREAIRLGTHCIYAHDHLGTVLWYRGDAVGAASTWRVSKQLHEAHVSRNPDDAGAAIKFAFLLANCPDTRLRNPKRAAELSARAVALAPEEAWLWPHRGLCLYRAGDWAAAMAAYEKAVERPNCRRWIYTWLGFALACWHTGDRDRARRCHAEALGTVKQFPGTWEDPYTKQLWREVDALLAGPEPAPPPRLVD